MFIAIQFSCAVQISRVLQNVHAFYAQFLPMVEATIASQRKPIEDDLKNDVKVARWNDMNYWSLKHTIHKAHRAVHKRMMQLGVSCMGKLLSPTEIDRLLLFKM